MIRCFPLPPNDAAMHSAAEYVRTRGLQQTAVVLRRAFTYLFSYPFRFFYFSFIALFFWCTCLRRLRAPPNSLLPSAKPHSPNSVLRVSSSLKVSYPLPRPLYLSLVCVRTIAALVLILSPNSVLRVSSSLKPHTLDRRSLL